MDDQGAYCWEARLGGEAYGHESRRSFEDA
jgi:hypothetical protein